MYCLWLFSHNNGNVKYLQQRLEGSHEENIYYLALCIKKLLTPDLTKASPPFKAQLKFTSSRKLSLTFPVLPEGAHLP